METPKERFLRIVNEDAKITHFLLDANGDTCQLGAMMLEVGLPVRTGQSSPSDEASRLVCNEFGLTYNQLNQIMHTNDQYKTRRARQANLRKLAEKLWPN